MPARCTRSLAAQPRTSATACAASAVGSAAAQSAAATPTAAYSGGRRKARSVGGGAFSSRVIRYACSCDVREPGARSTAVLTGKASGSASTGKTSSCRQTKSE